MGQKKSNKNASVSLAPATNYFKGRILAIFISRYRLIFGLSIIALCVAQVYFILLLSESQSLRLFGYLKKNDSDVMDIFRKRKKIKNAIDIVFTYVNGSDPLLINQMHKYKLFISNKNRFQDNNGLKYSLRSIEKYAPWCRFIFIVTNGQKPVWLNASHPKIRLVFHDQIFPNRSHLPTFNSLAIESHLHLIPGLSERFLYFNDDIILGMDIWPSDFYTHSSGYRFRMAWSVPTCSVNCPRSWLGDGHCDKECNLPNCNYDEDDCDENKASALKQLMRSIRSYFSGQDNHIHKKLNITKKVAQPLKTYQYAHTLYMNLYENYLGYFKWLARRGNLTERAINNKLTMLYDKIIEKMSSKRSYELNEYLNTPEYNEDNTQWLFEFLFEDNPELFFSKVDRRVLILDYLKDEFLKINYRNFLSQRTEESIFWQFKKRKLLNVFSDSLVNVDRLFNSVYGYNKIRKVPSHVPHLISIDIMNSLQEKFKDEFEKTSSNRFRDGSDMQYAFSYYYYIMNELDVFDEQRMFDQIDMDSNGYVDDIEVTIALFKLVSIERGNSFSQKIKASKAFTSLLDECRNNNTHNTTLTKLNRHGFLKCKRLVNFLRKNFWFDYEGKRFKYNYELVSSDDSIFIMVSGIPAMIKGRLEYLAQKPRKFMCLNDNINYNQESRAYELQSVINGFYEALFPDKSKFELR
jgi:UDP-N-acetylglucosamine-lysosomal-enzyme